MDVVLEFLSSAAAGNGIAIDQAVFCDFGLVTADAFASPVNGSLAVPSLGWFDGCQPAECLSGQVSARRADGIPPQASAASDPSVL